MGAFDWKAYEEMEKTMPKIESFQLQTVGLGKLPPLKFDNDEETPPIALKTGYFFGPNGEQYYRGQHDKELYEFKLNKVIGKKQWMVVVDIEAEETLSVKNDNDTQKVRGIRYLSQLSDELMLGWAGSSLQYQPFAVYSLLPDGKSLPEPFRKTVETWRKYQWTLSLALAEGSVSWLYRIAASATLYRP